MRRADRLFQIIHLLSRRRVVTAHELAEHLDVSKRTVYRDIVDLSASGVPIQGEAGVGYSLDPSYRLPPLMFDADEAEALVVGMRMVETWGDDALRRAARSILAKVEAVLPPPERERLSTTALFSLSFSRTPATTRHLAELRRAINGHCKVRLRYRTGTGAESARTVCPLGLWFWGASWTVGAWCELRADYRNFRVDRIEELEWLDEPFEHRSPTTLKEYVAAMSRELG